MEDDTKTDVEISGFNSLDFYKGKSIKIIWDNKLKAMVRKGIFLGSDNIFIFVLTDEKEVETIPKTRIIRIINDSGE